MTVYYISENIAYKEWEKVFINSENEPKFNLIYTESILQFEKEIERYSNLTIMKLSEEEGGILLEYKSFESYIINEEFRIVDNIEELSPIQRSFVNKLDTALSKIPKYSGNLIRTINFNCSEKTEKFLSEFIEGKIITTDQYWSTSKQFGYDNNVGIWIYIQDFQKGRNISMVGLDEQEMLYERKT